MRRWRFEASRRRPGGPQVRDLMYSYAFIPKSLISAFGATTRRDRVEARRDRGRFSFAPQWGIVRNTHQKQQK